MFRKIPQIILFCSILLVGTLSYALDNTLANVKGATVNESQTASCIVIYEPYFRVVCV